MRRRAYDHATRDIHILFTTPRGDGKLVLIWTPRQPLGSCTIERPRFLVHHASPCIRFLGRARFRFRLVASARQVYFSLP